MFKNIQVTNFRNIAHLDCEFNSQFNLIYGANGSGKTSLLEAIYVLLRRHSFRTRRFERIIRYEQDELIIFSHLQTADHLIPVGFSRHQNGTRQIRLSGQEVSSIVEITKLVPLQLLDPECHRLLNGGPKERRAFMDWGVFHVEHSFLTHWQRLQRAIKQRNAALQQQASSSDVHLWDEELIIASEAIDQLRERYLAELWLTSMPIIEQLLPAYPLKFTYQRGWMKGRALAQILLEAYPRDSQLGYTQFAAHRADIRLAIEGVPAQDILSQGQQKLLVYALKLAQGKLLADHLGHRCVYLLDDLTAELDILNQAKIVKILNELQAQVFITGLDEQSLQRGGEIVDAKQMFHVEHGEFKVVK